MHLLPYRTKQKNSCIVMHPTYILQQGIKLHANQQKILLEKGLNVESLKRKDSMSYLYLKSSLYI